jgi:hypothetical protein
MTEHHYSRAYDELPFVLVDSDDIGAAEAMVFKNLKTMLSVQLTNASPSTLRFREISLKISPSLDAVDNLADLVTHECAEISMFNFSYLSTDTSSAIRTYSIAAYNEDVRFFKPFSSVRTSRDTVLSLSNMYTTEEFNFLRKFLPTVEYPLTDIALDLKTACRIPYIDISVIWEGPDLLAPITKFSLLESNVNHGQATHFPTPTDEYNQHANDSLLQTVFEGHGSFKIRVFAPRGAWGFTANQDNNGTYVDGVQQRFNTKNIYPWAMWNEDYRNAILYPTGSMGNIYFNISLPRVTDPYALLFGGVYSSSTYFGQVRVVVEKHVECLYFSHGTDVVRTAPVGHSKPVVIDKILMQYIKNRRDRVHVLSGEVHKVAERPGDGASELMSVGVAEEFEYVMDHMSEVLL